MLAICNHLPSIERIFKEEKMLNRESNRSSISELKKIIAKEQNLTKEINYSIRQELVCDDLNWGYSARYQWN